MHKANKATQKYFSSTWANWRRLTPEEFYTTQRKDDMQHLLPLGRWFEMLIYKFSKQSEWADILDWLLCVNRLIGKCFDMAKP